MKNYQARIEMLQETHKYLDRQCTDLQKKNASSKELIELKKKKLQIRDQIQELKRLQNEETVQ